MCFMVGLVEEVPSNMVSESGDLEIEPRPRIISLRVISVYKSLYGRAHVA
jgi:hypothetical protein